MSADFNGFNDAPESEREAVVPQSDTDRLMDLVSRIYEEAAKGLPPHDWPVSSCKAIRNLCEQEMLSWRDHAQDVDAVRDAAFRDTGIRTVAPKDADLDPLVDEF